MGAVTHAGLVDLAAARVGGRALGASDEFFAPRHNLLAAGPPAVIEGEYTHRGERMGGWGKRRRRGPGGGYDLWSIPPRLPGGDRAGYPGNTPLPWNHPT